MVGAMNKLRNQCESGVVTLVSSVGLYLHTVAETKLVVDTPRGDTLRINVMQFALSMSLSLLLHDHFLVLTPWISKRDIIKRRLNSHGNIIETRRDKIGATKVTFKEEHISILHFLTRVCAIVVVFGIIDAFIYHGHKEIKKKMEMGKFS